jgi:hypothetical protein
MAKDRVFVDTNVILEAFRTGCWAAICERYAVETVEKCIEEALTGDPTEPGRVDVPAEDLIKGLAARHAVGKKELATFALKHPECLALDDGELHLLAWLDANGLLSKVLVLMSTADKAAIVATGRLNGLDALVSLEHLAQNSGATRAQLADLKDHYRASWLDGIKVKVRFGIIP